MIRLNFMCGGRGKKGVSSKMSVATGDSKAAGHIPRAGFFFRQFFSIPESVFSLLCLTHDSNFDNRQSRPLMYDDIGAAGILFGPVAQY